MECLHGKLASSSITKNGLFWYCGQKPSCQFFCPEEDCYMFGKAVDAFRASGCIQPVCHTHQKLATMRMVKDKMKESYGRPYFVCSERENHCSFWQWGDIFESPKPFCRHGMVCCGRKVKKDGINKDRLFYSCPNDKENSCGFFEWKPQEDPLEPFCTVLFSKPPSYRYTVKKTGETFTSRETDHTKAYEEYLFQKSVDVMTIDLEK